MHVCVCTHIVHVHVVHSNICDYVNISCEFANLVMQTTHIDHTCKRSIHYKLEIAV